MGNWVYKGSVADNCGAVTTDTGFTFHAPPGGSLGDVLVVWLITENLSTLDLSAVASTGGINELVPPISGPEMDEPIGWHAIYSDIIHPISGQPLQAILLGKLFYPGDIGKTWHVGFTGTGTWAWASGLWAGTAQLNRFGDPIMQIQGPNKIDRSNPLTLGPTHYGGDESGGGPSHTFGALSRLYSQWPAGDHPGDGDYVILTYTIFDPTNTVDITLPSDWVLIERVLGTGSGGFVHIALGHVWNAAVDEVIVQNVDNWGVWEACTFFPLSFDCSWVGFWWSWPGVDSLGAHASVGTTSDTITIVVPSITTTTPDATIVVLHGRSGSNYPGVTFTNPTGLISLYGATSLTPSPLGFAGTLHTAGATGVTDIENFDDFTNSPEAVTCTGIVLALEGVPPTSTTINFGSADDSASTPPETDALLVVAAGLGGGGQIGGAPTGCTERIRSDSTHLSLSLSEHVLTTDISTPGTIAVSSAVGAPWITVAQMLRSFQWANDIATAGAPVLTGAATATNTVDLSWTAATAAFGAITEYDILRDDGAGGPMVALATVAGAMLVYHDRTSAYSKTYNYEVYGKASGISGAMSNVVTVTTPSSGPVSPPSIPTGLRYTLNNGTEVDLVWNPSVPGSSAITGYTIYQDGVPIGTSVHPSYHDTSVQPATTYTYTVDCYDANGAQSGESLPLSVTTPNIGPDVTLPSIPTALAATPISGTEIDLTWTASTDPDSPALGYTIYRDTNPVGAVTGTSFADHGLTPSTLYTYNVDAYDPAGNHSAQSPNASATTLADTGPSAPGGLTGFANGPYGVCLAWSVATAGSHAVAGYTVLRDAVVIGTTTALKFTDVTCDPARTYVYTVQAFDTIGLVSAASSGLSLTTQSTLWTPPKVWELSDPATSIELNTYGRDNLLHLKGTTWTSFTYLNSFTGYHGDAQYRRLGPWIYLQGMVAGPANNAICTRLPPGFCPLREVVKIVWGRIGAMNVGPMRVNILPTGDIVIGGGVGLAGVVTYCSLNQICFSQDGR